MTSVVWVLNAGNYEVSSKDHLLCLLHNGDGYSPSGDVPSSYFSSSTKYLQTADIDLQSAAVSSPYYAGGSGLGWWNATYDGNGYSISNLNVQSQDGREYCGMFGGSAGGTIKNLTLTGVCTMTVAHASVRYAGMISARAFSGNYTNITMDLDSGSQVTVSNNIGSAYVGGMFAWCENSTVHTLTMRGHILISITSTVALNMIGSMIGYMNYTQYGAVGDVSTYANVTITMAAGSSTYWCGGMIGVCTFGSIAVDQAYNNGVGVVYNCSEISMDVYATRAGGTLGGLGNNQSTYGYTGKALVFQGTKGNLVNRKAGGWMGLVASQNNYTNHDNQFIICSHEGDIDNTGSAGYVSILPNFYTTGGTVGYRGWAYLKGNVTGTSESTSFHHGQDTAKYFAIVKDDATFNGSAVSSYSDGDYVFVGSRNEVGNHFVSSLAACGEPDLVALFQNPLFNEDLRCLLQPSTKHDGSDIPLVYSGNALVSGGDFTVVAKQGFADIRGLDALTQTEAQSSEGYRYTVDTSGLQVKVILGYDGITPPSGYAKSLTVNSVSWTVNGSGHYQVESTLQLMEAFGSSFTTSTELSGNATRTGLVFVLTGDLNLNSVILLSSGDPSFAGTFDGKGFEISNLIMKSTSSATRVGLCSELQGTVTNLNVGGTVSLTVQDSGVSRAALLVALASAGSEISNVTVNATSLTTSVSSCASTLMTGAVVGECLGTISSVKLSCSTSTLTADVAADSAGLLAGKVSAGAVASDLTVYSNGGSVGGAGTVSQVGTVAGYFSPTGAGSATGTFASFFSGAVSATGGNAGGLFGSFAVPSGTTCHLCAGNAGNVTGGAHAGGLIGEWKDSGAGSCSVSAAVTSSGDVSGTSSAGPLLGSYGGTFDTNLPVVNATNSYCALKGNVTGAASQSAALHLGNASFSGFHYASDTGCTVGGASLTVTSDHAIVAASSAIRTTLSSMTTVDASFMTLPVPSLLSASSQPLGIIKAPYLSKSDDDIIGILQPGEQMTADNGTVTAGGSSYSFAALRNNVMYSSDASNTLTLTKTDSYLYMIGLSVVVLTDRGYEAPEVITWTITGGRYEVPTKWHLLWLLSGGYDGRVVSSGSSPSFSGTFPNVATTSKYIQTADIDVLEICGESGEYLPQFWNIFRSSDFSTTSTLIDRGWRGGYLGNGYTISNVRAQSHPNAKCCGLFPYIYAAGSGSVSSSSSVTDDSISDIRLGGVCKTFVKTACSFGAGILTGYVWLTHVNRVDATLDSGSGVFVTWENLETPADSSAFSEVSGNFSAGLLIGYSYGGCVFHAIVKGYADVSISKSGAVSDSNIRAKYVGGMIGQAFDTSGKCFGNSGLFIEGDVTCNTKCDAVGGLAGYWRNVTAITSLGLQNIGLNLLHNRIGNITCTGETTYGGGCIGQIGYSSGYLRICNSIVGNLDFGTTTSNGSCHGGCIGSAPATGTQDSSFILHSHKGNAVVTSNGGTANELNVICGHLNDLGENYAGFAFIEGDYSLAGTPSAVTRTALDHHNTMENMLVVWDGLSLQGTPLTSSDTTTASQMTLVDQDTLKSSLTGGTGTLGEWNAGGAFPFRNFPGYAADETRYWPVTVAGKLSHSGQTYDWLTVSPETFYAPGPREVTISDGLYYPGYELGFKYATRKIFPLGGVNIVLEVGTSWTIGVPDAGKSSYISLYAHDNLAKRALWIQVSDGNATYTFSDGWTVSCPSMEFSYHGVADVGDRIAKASGFSDPAFTGNPTLNATPSLGTHSTVEYTSLSGSFAAGETVSNGSGASGTVILDDATSMVLAGVTGGPFSVGNTLTGGTSGATATASAVHAGTEIFSTTRYVNDAISNGAYAPNQSPNFSGTPAVPTATSGDSTTQVANTAFVNGEIASRCFLLASGGTAGAGAAVNLESATAVLVPTAAGGTNSAVAASTAFVNSAKQDLYPLASGGTATGGAVDATSASAVTVPTSSHTAVTGVSSKEIANSAWVIGYLESRIASAEASLEALTSSM